MYNPLPDSISPAMRRHFAAMVGRIMSSSTRLDLEKANSEACGFLAALCLLNNLSAAEYHAAMDSRMCMYLARRKAITPITRVTPIRKLAHV